MGRLEGKTALVTGAAQGIGAEIVRLFAEEGASVAFTYRDSRAKAEELASQVPGSMVTRLDVTKARDVRRVVDGAVKRLGGLDILVNNASFSAPSSFALGLEDIRDEDWRRALDVDVTGTFLVTKAAAPHLRARKGAVVNFASAASLQGDAAVLLYSASKAGVVGFTRCLAKSMAPDVRVNAIAPGSVATGWMDKWKVSRAQLRAIVGATPLRRLGWPDELAKVALFLASSDSAFMTGQTLVVDGGIYMA